MSKQGQVVAIVQCWNDPQATEKREKRTKLLVDYIFTDKEQALVRLEQAKEHYPMYGWTIDYRWIAPDHNFIF